MATLPTILLAAIDESSTAELVILRAAALARSPDAELHVAHVVESLGLPTVTIGGSPMALPSAAELMRSARKHLERHVLDAQNQRGDQVTGHLRIGTPWREVVQLATDIECDMLIIGTHDAKGLERLLLGSRAEVIVRSATCPVLVVRPKTVHRSDVPDIEPPCPDCVEARRASNGEKFWCARHSEKHAQAHTYFETPESFGMGSQTTRDD